MIKRDDAAGRDVGVVLTGSASELTRLASLAASAIASVPALDAAYARILHGFLENTANERRRYRDEAPAAATIVAARHEAVRTALPAVLGTVLLVVTLLAAVTAAIPPLPAKASLEIDPAGATQLGTIAAYVGAIAALASMVLPAWGGSDMRDQTWKLMYASAALIAVGLIAGSGGVGGDVVLGSELWAIWVAACLGALLTIILGAEVRRRRRPRGVEPISLPDGDGDYFRAIESRKIRAIREVELLVRRNGEKAKLVDQGWRSAVESARRDGLLAARTASSALSVTAFRWQLERSSEPDFGGDE